MELRLTEPPNGIAKDLSDLVELEQVGDTWLRYRTSQPEIINPQIVKQLTEKGIQIVTLAEINRSLEEVYLRVVDDDGGDRSTAN
jgi:ABC-2 type transport system ATP-binding protein